MRPSRAFFLCLPPSLAIAALLPIYPRRTMTRSQMSGHGGDVIEWGFDFCSVPGFFDDFGYMRPEQHPTANLAVILLLAGGLGLALALGAARWWARRSRA